MNYLDKEIELIVKHAECLFDTKYVSAFSMTTYNDYIEEEYKETGKVIENDRDTVAAIEKKMGIEIERKTFRFIPHYFEKQDVGIICVTWRLKGK